MKRIIIAIALLTSLLSACSLDKGYLNGPNASTFPANEDEIKSGLYAAYKGLSALIVQDTPMVGMLDNATDIATSRIGNSTTQQQQTSQMQVNSAITKNFYTQMYKIAGRVNLVLDGMGKLKDSVPEADYNMYLAELLLIRSYIYDLGCQFYGDIPYITTTQGLDANYTRNDRATVINSIINEDLKDELLDYLPLRHNKESYGSVRIGRAGAYGLKARICLNWGMYAEAAQYAAKAIELAEAAGYKLEAFDMTYCGKDHTAGEPSVVNLFGYSGYKNSDEIIWSMEYNPAISGNTHNGLYMFAQRPAGGCSYWSPGQAFLDAIQCKDGKSILESSQYNWQKPWENRDPRLDLFCVRPGSRFLGIQFETNPSTKTVKNYNTGLAIANSEATGTKSEYGANGSKGPCGYLWRKHTDIAEYLENNSALGTRSVCHNSFPLMRLAELYLVRAEANIEMEGGDLSLAKRDIERIRTRVAMPALVNSDRDALRSALRYERMVELCNEGFRWFDIRRWKIAATNLNCKFYAPNANGTISNAKPIIDANWHVTYSEDSTWDDKALNLRLFLEMKFDEGKDYNWPIPEAERTALPSITQNPGYSAE